MPKKKLNFHDRSDRLLSIIKTRQDNNVIVSIGLVYAKIEAELSGSIEPSVVCYNNMIDRIGTIYTKNEI